MPGSFLLLLLLLFSLLPFAFPQALFPNKCGERCGHLPIPFPFHLNSSCGPAIDSFRLSCSDDSTPSALFLTLGSTDLRIIDFLPSGFLLLDYSPNSTSSCDPWYSNVNRSSFVFDRSPFFAVTADNVLRLYACEDSSVCKIGCDRIGVVGGCDGKRSYFGCCYPLSDGSVWKPGDGFSVFAEYGCRGFSSWVVRSASGEDAVAQRPVGPRISHDRQHFPPNNIINMLFGAGLLWMGWSGFNGGAPGSTNSLASVASLAVLNTHLCTATSLSVWLFLDMLVYRKSSVIGAVQGMITGLVCITPAAGLVEPWAAMLMGTMSGSVPWYTMMVLHRRAAFLQKVDDTLGVFHTHAVAGTLGGLLAGLLAHPRLTTLFSGNDHSGLFYNFNNGRLDEGFKQLGYQLLGAVFIAVWNVVITTAICLAISKIVPLRMNEDDLNKGDDAAHGEEAYALWGDGERTQTYARWSMTPVLPAFCRGFRGR